MLYTRRLLSHSPANMSLHNASPTLPEVYDEAGKSPGWVPALGVGLFLLFALVVGARYFTHKAVPPTAADKASDTSGAPAAPAPQLGASS
jgi:hypothetical protein